MSCIFIHLTVYGKYTVDRIEKEKTNKTLQVYRIEGASKVHVV